MVASLTRLPWNVFSKSLLHYDKFFVVTCTNRFCSLGHYSTQQRNSRNFDRTVKDFLTYTVLISSLSYTIYKWKDDFRKQFSSFGSLFPTVKALSLPLSTISQNRDRYNFIADVVEISAPSVVYIEITDSRRYDRFTGRPIPTSSGSGFIVRHDGLILTNAHVVINKPNMPVKVRLHDGTTYQGVVEDVDMQSDLATVRINKKNLPVMKLGSSANLRPGEFVVAIGSPLSLSNSITSGVVSSPCRQSEELGLLKKHMGYIQTDAPITFGNSGGPLVNLNGEAIGINSMKVTAGISFAIPIDYAKEFLKNTEHRRANKGSHNVADTPKRRYIGVTMLTLTPDIIYEIQQKSGGIQDFVKHGVLIWKVVTGSPAHMGGLRAGDVITHVNDEPVVAAVNIYKTLEKPGPLDITVVREREVLRIKVTPEEI